MSANAVGRKRPNPPLLLTQDFIGSGSRHQGKGGGPDRDDRRNQGGEGAHGAEQQLRPGQDATVSSGFGVLGASTRPGRPGPTPSKGRTVHLGLHRGTGVPRTPRNHAGLRATVGLGPGLPPDGTFGTLGSG